MNNLPDNRSNSSSPCAEDFVGEASDVRELNRSNSLSIGFPCADPFTGNDTGTPNASSCWEDAGVGEGALQAGVGEELDQASEEKSFKVVFLNEKLGP